MCQILQELGLQQGNQAVVSHVGLSVGERGVIGFVGSWIVMALLLTSCWGRSCHPRPLHTSKDVLGRTCVLLGIYLLSTRNLHTQTGSSTRAQRHPTGRLGWTLQGENGPPSDPMALHAVCGKSSSAFRLVEACSPQGIYICWSCAIACAAWLSG